MLKKMFFVVTVLSLAVLAAHPWPARGVQAVVAEPPGPSLSEQAAAPNLLPNGNMDQVSFYWRPTNHYIAGMWYEWFWTGAIPEFLDGGIPYHNACYPRPSGLCGNNHSQGYIRYGAPYVAGIYQPVAVTPCTNYRFEAYNSNDDSNYHPKVGIDPTGQGLPSYIPPDGDTLPLNCPPDGHSKCPNPGLADPSQLPPHIVWSPEFDHAAFSWAAQNVTAEALSTTITVWTYVAPDLAGSPSRSTYWDAASLVQVQPPLGALMTGTLPLADGSITNLVTSTTALRANLSWQTSQAAVTQVLYHYVGDAAMPSPPPVVTSTSAFESHTLVDSTASTAHSARLADVRPNSLYDYAILSRRLAGSTCQTSALSGRFRTTDALLLNGPLPPPTGITGPIILPFSDFAYVIWQSAQPSYGQVLYHYDVYTPTVYPNRVYLPLIAATMSQNYYGSTDSYEFRTLPDLTLSTLHVITITANLMPDSPYAAVAVSAWTEGNLDKAAASTRTLFQTKAASALTAANVHPDQLTEQLQACLAGGKTLDVCVDELSR